MFNATLYAAERGGPAKRPGRGLAGLKATLLLLALALLGFSPSAWADAGFQKDFVIVNAKGAGNAYYDTFYDTSNPNFQGASLGSFVAGNSLILSGAESHIYKNGAGNVSGVRLNYRVYLSGSTAPAYTALTLPFKSDDGNDGNGTAYQTWQQTGAGIQLLNPSMVTGTYIVEVYLDGTNLGENTTFYDSNNNADYQATFTVTQPAYATTPDGQSSNWVSGGIGLQNTDWLNSYNWSNGVPTTTSDAVIPGHAPSDITTVAPQLDNPAALYVVHTLTMLNSDYTYRSIIRLGKSTTSGTSTVLVGATLRIYGDFTSPNYGLLASVSDADNQGVAKPATNSTLVFAGNTTQNITNTNITVADVRIEGTGDKKFNGSLEILNTLIFTSGTTARLITTDASGNPVQNAGTAQVLLDDGSQLSGETNSAFIYGTTKAQRTLFASDKQTFGGIGLDITASGNITGVTVTRIVGFNFSDSSPSTSVGIKRIYGVSGSTINSSNTTKTVVFHYLDSSSELNNIPESRLVMFRTANGNDGPFIQIPGTLDTDANTVTATGLTTINTLTLGDKNYPLPVTLASFDAVRSGASAVVTWTTASEVNSKGFTVEVSTDGTYFRSLGFVASQNPNSLTAQSYRFVDQEEGKTGTRYYRLLQTDLDGKSAYSGVVAVSFDGSAARATTSALVAYPNPFTDRIGLTLTGTPGGLPTRVKLVDMTGRLVREQAISTENGSLAIEGLDQLTPGLYLAKVSFGDGTTKTVRVQKQ